MAGLYIHIPFCASRCIYCGFYSTTLPQLQDRYVDALCREMGLSVPHSSFHFSTIYLGGGTPSQLSASNLHKIFLYINKVYGTDFRKAEDGSTMEITMECNPDDITPEFCDTLRTLPVNRISMGAQTFSDKRLRFLRRRHTAEEVRTAVKLLRGIGIGNISIDLMFGFPGETLDEWKSDIRECLALDVEHISAYSLMYEEGTPLHRMLSEGKIREVDDELSLLMYDTLINSLTAAGFEHYEISNFAKHSFRSRHNSSYWHSIPYIGIGAAAHSYDIRSRWWNVSDVRKYIESIERGELPCEREELDKDTRYNDTVMTALRTCEGIDTAYIAKDFGAEYREYLMRCAQKNIALGNLVAEGDHIRLSRKGIYISDGITADLFR